MTRPLSDDAIVEKLKASDPVPEPSPLFWEHAARRVRAAVDAEPPRRSVWWGRLAWGGGLAAASLAALLVLPVREASEPTTTRLVTVAPAVPELPDLDDDSWTLVAELGGDLDVEAAARAGWLERGGTTTDRAVQALDQAERTELATLLHRALDKPEI